MKLRTAGGLAATLTAAGLIGTAAPAQAESAPGCSGTTQIGSTAYVSYGGQTVASVKQFKGCGKNWAYVYAWQAFVNTGKSFTAQAGIGVYPSGSSSEPDRYLGITQGAAKQRELWSTGTDTLSNCTAAYGGLYIGGRLYDAHTSIRC
jgi:hypothetical protein